MPKVIGNRKALEIALSDISKDGVKPNEFTVEDFRQEALRNGRRIATRTVRDTLRAKVESGDLVVRKVILDGNVTNAYSTP